MSKGSINSVSPHSCQYYAGGSTFSVLADCVDLMKTYDDGQFDLAIVDVPYGSSNMSKNKYARHKTTDTTYRNKSTPGQEYWNELYRVSKEQIIWGCQYLMPYLKPEGSFIVWDKKANPDLHNMSSCDIAWYSKRKQIKTWDGHWCGAVKCEREPTIHIHQKPIGLYKFLLSNYAEKGMKILDTHLGSGSSRIAADELGFEFVGIEIDKTYYERQEIRFKNYKSQMRLW
jgi:site-specific DNA-methyltransferase (adenine-specific)